MFSAAQCQSKSKPARCHTTALHAVLSFLVYYMLSTMLEVQTLSQVCLGLKMDFCKLKLCLQISLTCQMISIDHLDFSLV